MKSEKYNVVFIHIPKTAGRSVAAAFEEEFLHRTVNAYPDIARYRSLSVVRNPWDRLVSIYHYAKSYKAHQGTRLMGPRSRVLPFASWLMYHRDNYTGPFRFYEADGRGASSNEAGSAYWFSPQVQWLRDEHGQLAVETVIRFEELAKSWEKVVAEFGVGPLPHRNKTERGDYREYYDDYTRDVVADFAEEDIKEFGFSF
ncbi:MAG: hypothetical protein GEU79_12160 [Acidimicrobiia bacterium]|nr:hypothetical protein [Acidimicrobiia bacterium]